MAPLGKILEIPAADGSMIDARLWHSGREKPRAVVFIVHGMAEHIDRYDGMARFMNENGLAVYGMNLRGHGPKAIQPGWFGSGEGWREIMDDLDRLRAAGQNRFSGVPQIVLGHSMGSFVTRLYMTRPRLAGSNPLPLPAGVVLSGSADVDSVSAAMMRFLATAGCLFRGGRHPSGLLHQMAFAANNKPFRKEGSTGVEWLSRDRDNVRRYAADPLCGFVCTTSFYRELGRGLARIGRPGAFKAYPREVPLLIAAGTLDPIGSFGKGPLSLDLRYRKAGVTDVTRYMVDGGRHEIFNETDKAVTWNFVLTWITDLL